MLYEHRIGFLLPYIQSRRSVYDPFDFFPRRLCYIMKTIAVHVNAAYCIAWKRMASHRNAS